MTNKEVALKLMKRLKYKARDTEELANAYLHILDKLDKHTTYEEYYRCSDLIARKTKKSS